MIDLHCHLLPGIDDGPDDLDAALVLADALAREGVDVVAATPHVSPRHPNTAEAIGAARGDLVAEMAARGIGLQVVAGAELDLLHLADLGRDELDAVALGGGGTLLVECPFSPAVPFMEERVARLQADGFRVLLAHPERSPAFLREPALLQRLVAAGAMASLTAASLGGRFGRTARRYAAWALDEGLVHDVATDAHDVAGRGPALSRPVQDAGYGWAADWLMRAAPAAILAGAELPPRPSRPRRWPSLRRGAPGRR